MELQYSRRDALRAGGVLVAGGLAGCSGDGGGGDGDNVVDMTDGLVFEPETLTVSTGTTVTWETVGAQGHSVTAYEDDIPEDADYFASGGFDSQQAAVDAYPSEGNVPSGESYEHTFEVAGTYEYFCIPHEASGMVGTIEVEE
jgi:plastocyanin